MRDLSAQLGTRIGLNPPSREEDLQSAVIRKAREHGIELEPKQVVVQRSGDPNAPNLYLRAQYDARVNLLGYSFALHFTPSSRNKGL